jgi:hypothetical protein
MLYHGGKCESIFCGRPSLVDLENHQSVKLIFNEQALEIPTKSFSKIKL